MSLHNNLMLSLLHYFRIGRKEEWIMDNEKRKTEKNQIMPFAKGVIVALSFILYPLSFIHSAQAAKYPELTYRYEHHLFSLDPNLYPLWRTTQEVWSFDGSPIRAPRALRVDGDTTPELPPGITRSIESVWNTEAIAKTIDELIGIGFKRPRGEVTIGRTEDGIAFEGVGLLGRSVDAYKAAELTTTALENGITDIHLPVTLQQPVLRITDPALADAGIQEVVAVGESNFAGSPESRQHNIRTGLEKFNGHLIEQGAVFSFNDILGPVNDTTGYLKELVIQGDKTLPDYGGGLCQVSTTAYRGAWEYGFPITKRRNHSFAVQYYSPQGTDATIYPPYTDMQFENDSPGVLLIQTHTEDGKAYFIYYGTKDERSTEIIGPFVWDKRSPPPDKVEYTDDIGLGETRSVGKAVPGMQSAWFRVREPDTEAESIEPVYSFYEARPNFTQIGGYERAPSWLGVD